MVLIILSTKPKLSVMLISGNDFFMKCGYERGPSLSLGYAKH
jgi:hypothetical protein